jgi:hypothetical protein
MGTVVVVKSGGIVEVKRRDQMRLSYSGKHVVRSGQAGGRQQRQQKASCLLYLATLRFETPKQEAASLPNIAQD